MTLVDVPRSEAQGGASATYARRVASGAGGTANIDGALPMTSDWVVLVGAPRDDIFWIVDDAHRMGKRIMLLEDHRYLLRSDKQKLIDQAGFDRLALVGHDGRTPGEADVILQAIDKAGLDKGRLATLISGQEIFTRATWRARKQLGLVHASNPDFDAIEKLGLRYALQERGAPQPRFAPLAGFNSAAARRRSVAQVAEFTDGFRRPGVVKVAPSGGGRGIAVVNDAPSAKLIFERLAVMEPYEWVPFQETHIEELVGPSTHISVQGVAENHRARILSWAQKITRLEPANGFDAFLPGFDEVAIMVRNAASVPPGVLEAAQDFIDATGYPAGAFHVDIELVGQGRDSREMSPYYLVERPSGVPVIMEGGYRTSGHLTKIVKAVSGASWHARLLTADLGVPPFPDSAPVAEAAGVRRLFSQREVDTIRALAAGRRLHGNGGPPLLTDVASFDAMQTDGWALVTHPAVDAQWTDLAHFAGSKTERPSPFMKPVATLYMRGDEPLVREGTNEIEGALLAERMHAITATPHDPGRQAAPDSLGR